MEPFIAVDFRPDGGEELNTQEDLQLQLFPPKKNKDMSAFLLPIGVSEMKTDQYDRIYRSMSDFSTKHGVDEEYPYSSTISRRHRAIAVRTMFAKLYVKSFDIDMKRAGARGATEKYTCENSAPVMIVTPWQWVRIYF